MTTDSLAGAQVAGSSLVERSRRSLPRFSNWRGPSLSRWVLYSLLLLSATISMMPFFWMVSTSFKAPQELSRFPPTWLPETFNVSNYVEAVTATDFVRQLANSVIYAGGGAISNLVFCSLAGFALARMTFPGQKVMFGLIIALLMVPAQSQIIPVFVILKHFPLAGGNDLFGTGGTGLLNSYFGLIMPTAVTPLGIFLMRQFFRSIPSDYDEAARLDGATSLGVLWHVILPLARPAMATLAVITFQFGWNDFVWPLILTNQATMQTLQLGLQQYTSGPDAQWQILMAASTLNILPMVLLFICAQRYFVGGLNMSGVKG